MWLNVSNYRAYFSLQPGSGGPPNDPYRRDNNSSSGFPGNDRRDSRPDDHYRSSSDHHHRDPPPSAPAISEVEFEEILQRNKTVSSSAISRAVQDASAGMKICTTP